MCLLEKLANQLCLITLFNKTSISFSVIYYAVFMHHFLREAILGEPMVIKLKRAYELPDEGDGFRVLVDRLWPRGVSKDTARINLWLKEIAPSVALREWFGHDPTKWATFRDQYYRELDNNLEAVEQLRKRVLQGKVTLVYGAKDQEHNNAVALKEYLESDRTPS